MTTESKPGAPRIGVWQLAWPAVVTNLMQSTVGLIDVKVVGTLGADAVAAATAGHRLFFVLQAVLMAVSAGMTALAARAWGAGDREEASRVTQSSLMIGAGIGAAMGVIGFAVAEPFAEMLGLVGEPVHMAATFLRWISGFSIFFAVSFVLGVAMRAVGDTRTPLWIGAFTNVVNAFCLYLFVYGGLGFPSMGIAGAALAGGVAFAVGGVLSLWLWTARKLPIQPVRGDGLNNDRVRRLLRIGYPAAIEQFFVQAGFFTFTFIIARFYGAHALAAYGIGVQILSLSFVVGFGFSIAASTLVGQHLGAGDPKRAAASGWRALRLAMGSMTVLSIIIVGFAKPIAEMMIDDPEVVRLTVAFMYLLGAAQPLMAIEFALAGALRGAGDTRFPLITTFFGLIVGRVMLAIFFTSQGLPVEWIYGALMADYLLKGILLVNRFRSNKWQRVISARPLAGTATAE